MVTIDAEQSASDPTAWNIFLSNGVESRVIGLVSYIGSKESLIAMYEPVRLLAKFKAGDSMTDTELEIIYALG
jgi:hypothetical protein